MELQQHNTKTRSYSFKHKTGWIVPQNFRQDVAERFSLRLGVFGRWQFFSEFCFDAIWDVRLLFVPVCFSPVRTRTLLAVCRVKPLPGEILPAAPEKNEAGFCRGWCCPPFFGGKCWHFWWVVSSGESWKEVQVNVSFPGNV